MLYSTDKLTDAPELVGVDWGVDWRVQQGQQAGSPAWGTDHHLPRMAVLEV